MRDLVELLDFYAEFPDWRGVTPSLHQPNLFGDYPIHVAATRGKLDEIEILLGAGAGKDQVGEHNYTPIHCAVEQGCVEVVRFLIEKGANIDVRNSNGETPEELAALLGEDEILKFLREKRISQIE